MESLPRINDVTYEQIRSESSMLSDSDTDLEDCVETEECKDHVRSGCRCSTHSSAALASTSDVTQSYLHKRVADVVHKSHSEAGKTSLHLAYRHLGPESTLPICACLETHPLISTVDLSFNSLGERGGINVVLALVTNPYVSHLVLAGNKFGKTKVPAYLMVLLAHNHIIQQLNLSKNEFDDNDIYLISGGIMENDYVTDIDLSDNLIAQVGAGYLGRAMAINNSLDTVNLSGNCIRQSGAVKLGKSIMFNYMLSEISLRGNGLAYEGALAIRECLLKNTYLRKLDISGNRINWEGAIVLAHGLEANTTLHTFAAGNNPLTTTGCMDIIDAISSTCSLMVLDIQDINVVKEFRQVVQTIQDTNPEFKVIRGHVVRKHDILGLRTKRSVHPMHKIVTYLLERELRPVELLRIMDKTVSFKISNEELIDRCQQMGIDVKWYEKKELVHYILDKDMSEDVSTDVITYSILLRGIVRFLEEERLHRIEERRRAQALIKYQRGILDQILPQVSVNSPVNAVTGDLLENLFVCRDKDELVTNRLNKAVKSLAAKRKAYAFNRVHL